MRDDDLVPFAQFALIYLILVLVFCVLVSL